MLERILMEMPSIVSSQSEESSLFFFFSNDGGGKFMGSLATASTLHPKTMLEYYYHEERIYKAYNKGRRALYSQTANI
jgi:hypothetical protein